MTMTTAEPATFKYEQAIQILQSYDLLVARSQTELAADAPLRLILDSRVATMGDCFLVYKGVSSDAHRYIESAVKQRVSLVILEDPNYTPQACPYLLVRSARAAWAVLEATVRLPQSVHTFSGLVGVTGTNGKTSTVWLAKHLLQNYNTHDARLSPAKVSSIGTLGFYLNDVHHETHHTTPDPPLLYNMLATSLNHGCEHIVMEVSSHAVAQEKLLPLCYDTCVFTSFSRDHLDFHTSMEEYFECKWQLFTKLAKPLARKLVHSSIPLSDHHLTQIDTQDLTVYGKHAKNRAKSWGAAHFCEYRTLRTSITAGSVIEVNLDQQLFELTIPLFADHAIDNFVAAWLATAGFSKNTRDFSAIKQVPGRLEAVTPVIPQVSMETGKPLVVVDYAHTPDAIEKTLEVLRPLTKGKLWVVFGCGGDRDKGKRPLMAKAALSLADRVIITSDNPRTEDPESIITDICAGVLDKDTGKVAVKALREQAIAHAIGQAKEGDVILLAGKGHETYQIIGKTKHHFDDCEIARRYLK